jgi:hypothetical protein
MTGEDISNNQYRIAVTGEGEDTRIILKIMVCDHLNHSKLIVGPRVELLLCDVDLLIGLARETMAGPSKITVEQIDDDGSFLKLTRLDDLIQFKTHAMDSTMTMANVTQMLADLEQVRDAAETRLDGGVEFLETGGADTTRHHGLNG